MDFGIKDKKVLITGASRGIGASITKAFVEEGCRVTAISRDEHMLKKLIDNIGGTKRGHNFIAADLTRANAPSRVLKRILDGNDPFEIVVHSVGGALGIKDPLGPVEDWLKVWQFNVGIAVEMNALLVPPMKKRKWGRLIHISSISAEMGEPRLNPYGGAIPYAAAKSYLNAYVKGLGRELAEYNIIVSALMPGAVLSEGKYWDRLQKENPNLVKNFLHHYYAINRFGKAEEIAPFAVFMASSLVSFAAGAVIPIDGGRM